MTHVSITNMATVWLLIVMSLNVMVSSAMTFDLKIRPHRLDWVLEGDSINLTCSWKNRNKTYLPPVVWENSGREIGRTAYEGSRCESRSLNTRVKLNCGEMSSKIHITNLTSKDQWIISCHVEQESSRSRITEIKVLGKKKIVKSPLKNPYIVKEGSTMTLTCRIDDSPNQGLSFLWYKDGQTITQTLNVPGNQCNNSVLIEADIKTTCGSFFSRVDVRNVSDTAEGEWHCGYGPPRFNLTSQPIIVIIEKEASTTTSYSPSSSTARHGDSSSITEEPDQYYLTTSLSSNIPTQSTSVFKMTPTKPVDVLVVNTETTLDVNQNRPHISTERQDNQESSGDFQTTDELLMSETSSDVLFSFTQTSSEHSTLFKETSSRTDVTPSQAATTSNSTLDRSVTFEDGTQTMTPDFTMSSLSSEVPTEDSKSDRTSPEELLTSTEPDTTDTSSNSETSNSVLDRSGTFENGTQTVTPDFTMSSLSWKVQTEDSRSDRTSSEESLTSTEPVTTDTSSYSETSNSVRGTVLYTGNRDFPSTDPVEQTPPPGILGGVLTSTAHAGSGNGPKDEVVLEGGSVQQTNLLIIFLVAVALIVIVVVFIAVAQVVRNRNENTDETGANNSGCHDVETGGVDEMQTSNQSVLVSASDEVKDANDDVGILKSTMEKKEIDSHDLEDPSDQAASHVTEEQTVEEENKGQHDSITSKDSKKIQSGTEAAIKI